MTEAATDIRNAHSPGGCPRIVRDMFGKVTARGLVVAREATPRSRVFATFAAVARAKRPLPTERVADALQIARAISFIEHGVSRRRRGMPSGNVIEHDPSVPRERSREAFVRSMKILGLLVTHLLRRADVRVTFSVSRVRSGPELRSREPRPKDEHPRRT